MISNNIILGSSSPYRADLLKQLQLSFSQYSPDIDESASPNEKAQDLVVRLSKEKALAVAAKYNDHIIIASDQVALLNNEILTKPLVRETAIAQLQRCSGEEVVFYTGICVLNSQKDSIQIDVDQTTVKFRELDAREIAAYIDREQPLDCAGSFKVEGLGITLFESIKGDDPNSLIGLPLIKLVTMLKNEGVQVI